MTKYFMALMMVFNSGIKAQHVDRPVMLSHYVFNEFRQGQVKVRSGEHYVQALNYNILTGEMIFNQDGKYLAIQSPENVDTVYIDDRKFIPVVHKFYEVLSTTPAPLFLTILTPSTSQELQQVTVPLPQLLLPPRINLW